ALIHLPQNGLMVIDSKASKFLLDIASQVETTGEAAARMQLRNSMQTHLKQLAGRDYHQAVEQWVRAAKGEGALGMVVLVMYLPSEAMLE
ncbi:DNA recombination protein RmuC, partial [Escherichia coli]|uniref:DNA recombination protein RmuC n=1 Tax=Escherichia coli TaxID=562 RepID=UPI0028E01B65